MPSVDPLRVAVRELYRLAAAGENISDGQLLKKFLSDRDEAAFSLLVKRHGAMVLGVCRRVLQHGQDAEDAFQATFLVLYRRARFLGCPASLAGWLYTVAYHAALRARANRARQRRRERQVPPMAKTQSTPAQSSSDFQPILDEELNRLPQRYRSPVILCYLEGKTNQEAARLLGWPVGTVKGRLARARERLRKQLLRRGISLPAAALTAVLVEQASATVPRALVNTAVQATLAAAAGKAAGAGALSATAAGLADGVLKTIFLTKLKIATALILAVSVAFTGVLLAHRTLGTGPAGAAPEPVPKRAPLRNQQAAQAKKQSAPSVREEPVLPENKLSISGQIVDAAGKPVVNAQVGVFAALKRSGRGGDLSERLHVRAPTKTDSQGRFRLLPEHFDWSRFRGVQLVATAEGHGMAWKNLFPEDKASTVLITLPPEQVVRGRLVDLQGQPAAALTVHLFNVLKSKPAEDEVGVWEFHKDLPIWPKPVTTDNQGRFAFRGLGSDFLTGFQVFDDRFARQIHHIENKAGEAKEFTLTLAPAHIIEGQVTRADTGKPVPHARLTVSAGQGRLGSMLNMGGRADKQGRFRINPFPGDYFRIAVYPPDGEPYLIREKELPWPQGAVKHQVNLTVPRGVLVRGKVSESPSGKAVPGVSVEFVPREKDNPNLRNDIITGWQGAVVSGPDGVFQMVVLPGPGHLVFYGPTSHYIQMEMNSSRIYYDKPGGQRLYAHAWVRLLTTAGATPQELAVTLRRGVSVKGKIVDADGEPSSEVLMFSRLVNLFPHSGRWYASRVPSRDGRFELRGLDSKETYPVYFLDAKNKRGTVAHISGKDAGEQPVTVRLAPCGSAVVRFLDKDGKPVAGHSPLLQIVLEPGANPFDRKALEQGKLFEHTEFVSNLDRLNHWNGPRTDDQGRVTLPALIPGATYRITSRRREDRAGDRDFQVEAGKTLNLPDVILKEGR